MSGAALKLQFRFTQHVILKGLSDVTHEESLFRPQNGGNSINWITGHILATRAQMLTVLGVEPFWNADKSHPYVSGAESVPAEALYPLEELLETARKSLEQIDAFMDSADLNAPATDGKPIAERMAFFVAHESYHAGQIHLLRRMLEKPRMFG